MFGTFLKRPHTFTCLIFWLGFIFICFIIFPSTDSTKTYHRTLKKLSKHSGINRLGSAGVTTFYCTNYMSPQHFDRDVKLDEFFPDEEVEDFFSLTIQLDLSTADPDEFDFAYTEWGVILWTVPNLLWCVYNLYI